MGQTTRANNGKEKRKNNKKKSASQLEGLRTRRTRWRVRGRLIGTILHTSFTHTVKKPPDPAESKNHASEVRGWSTYTRVGLYVPGAGTAAGW